MQKLLLAGLFLAFGLLAPLVLGRYTTDWPEWGWRVLTILCLAIGFVLLWFNEQIYGKVWGDKYSRRSLILFALIAIGTMGGSIWWGFATPRQAASPTSSGDQSSIIPPTIHSLFKKDFSEYAGVTIPQDFAAKRTSDGTNIWKMTVETKICCDFTSKSKFLLIYVPKSDSALDFCSKLPSLLASIFEKLSTITVSSKIPTESTESSRDLVFTGKVYIYYENDFSPEELGQLSASYKSAGVFPQFRGDDYATYCWMAAREK